MMNSDKMQLYYCDKCDLLMFPSIDGYECPVCGNKDGKPYHVDYEDILRGMSEDNVNLGQYNEYLKNKVGHRYKMGDLCITRNIEDAFLNWDGKKIRPQKKLILLFALADYIYIDETVLSNCRAMSDLIHSYALDLNRVSKGITLLDSVIDIQKMNSEKVQINDVKANMLILNKYIDVNCTYDPKLPYYLEEVLAERKDKYEQVVITADKRKAEEYSSIGDSIKVITVPSK